MGIGCGGRAREDQIPTSGAGGQFVGGGGEPAVGGAAITDAGASGRSPECAEHPLGVSDCGCNAQWLRVVQPGGGDLAEDRVVAAATDPEGNVVVAGWTRDYPSGDPTAWIHTYAAMGTQQWSVAASDAAALHDVAVDTTGNVVASGYTPLAEGWLGKYAGDGTVLWTRTGDSVREGVTTDTTGSIYVTGPNLGVTKYDADGREVWTYATDLDAAPSQAIAVDTSNRIVVTGTSASDIVVTQLDPDGSPLWMRSYDGGDEDAAHDVAIDEDDNVYVVGRSRLMTTDRGLVAHGWLRKYSSTGDELWTHEEANAGSAEVGNRIALGRSGIAHVAWHERFSFDASGELLRTSPCRADALAADATDHLLLAGSVDRDPGNAFAQPADVWLGRYAEDPR